jgi:hypothetical protein
MIRKIIMAAPAAILFACSKGEIVGPVDPPPVTYVVTFTGTSVTMTAQSYPSGTLHVSALGRDSRGEVFREGFQWKVNGEIRTETSATIDIQSAAGESTQTCVSFRSSPERCETFGLPVPVARTGRIYIVQSEPGPTPVLMACAHSVNVKSECTDVVGDSYTLSPKWTLEDTMFVSVACRDDCSFIGAKDVPILPGVMNQDIGILASRWKIHGGEWDGVTQSVSLVRACTQPMGPYPPFISCDDDRSMWKPGDVIPVRVSSDLPSEKVDSVKIAVARWNVAMPGTFQLDTVAFIGSYVAGAEPGITMIRTIVHGSHRVDAWSDASGFITSSEVEVYANDGVSTIMHNLGHALRLSHSHDCRYGVPPCSWSSGIMSDFGDRQDPLYGRVVPEEVIYQSIAVEFARAKQMLPSSSGIDAVYRAELGRQQIVVP